MASERASRLQQILPHISQNRLFLDTILTAGDIESANREGHREFLQVEDALMRFLMLREGHMQAIR